MDSVILRKAVHAISITATPLVAFSQCLLLRVS
jgi:hypothetical protein